MADAPDTLDAVLDDLGRGLKLIADKADGYELARKMYEGTADEVVASPSLYRRLKANAEAHRLSFAHIPVDALVDKLHLSGITADGSAGDRLATLFDELDFDDEADDWHVKACYFGDYYVIVDPREETEDGEAVSVSVAGSSPLSTVMVYSSRDERSPLYGVKRWAEGTGVKRRWHAAVFYDDATVLLVTPEGQGEAAPTKPDAFLPNLDESGEAGSERVPHEGGRKLLVHYAVDGKPYGKPLHRKAFGAQDALTKINATNLAAVEAQGFPVRYALADPEAAIDDDLDADFGTDGPGTAPADGDGMTGATRGSRIKSEAGTLAILRGIKSVGEFREATPDGALKNLEWYVRAMAVITKTPLYEFDLGGEQPSGESRRRAERPLLKRAERVARAIGNAHKTLADTLLAVSGIAPDEANVSVKWAPLDSSLDADGFELVALKIKAGVPLRDALIEAGYDAQTVEGWGYTKDAPGFSLEAVALIADALTKLGTAETLGAVTKAEAAALLPSVLTAATSEGPAVDADEPDAAIVDDAADDPTADERDPRLVAAELELATANALRAKGDAVGVLVRAGADPEQAAAKAGLEGLTFPNVPVTVRIPDDAAAALEGGAPAAPEQPADEQPPAEPEA